MEFRTQSKKQNQPNDEQNNQKEKVSLKLSKHIKVNIDNLKNVLGEPDDLIIREFIAAGKACAVAYIDGIVDGPFLHKFIMEDLQTIIDHKKGLPEESAALLNMIEKDIITATEIERGKTIDDVSEQILSGQTIVYLDGVPEVLMINTIGGEYRSIEEPVTEGVIRGPREGFVENIQTNTALIRRRIKDPNLRLKTQKIGKRANKSLIVAYIDGVVHPKILEEVNNRLHSINLDDAPGSGMIEQWIEDSFLSPFPQVSNTERPDKVENALMQGKVAIILDGTPFVLLVPVVLGNTLQSTEDYNERWMISSLLRLLRYLAAFMAIFLPGLYVALTTYHTGLIPSDLAFSIAASREGVPFPATIEAVLMVTTMELLREAGARLPKPIGQTVGIVGGLVIGDAAVSAGIVSPIMVIVVALNAISSFAIPEYSTAISYRILMYVFLLASSFLGLYGIILVYIMMNIHIVNLKSFGIPYSTPFSPGFLHDWSDLILRLPAQILKRKRPQYLQPVDDKSSDQGGKEQ